jgi:hypothetical protein
MKLIIILILILLIFGGGGFYGFSRVNPSYGIPGGFGLVLIVLLVCFLLGLFRF